MTLESSSSNALLRPLTVFISGVTSEFRAQRDLLEQIFARYGAEVAVQKPYPSHLGGGGDIKRSIEEADLLVCLVGDTYGTPRPDQEGFPPHSSWTQYEYLYARQVARNDPHKQMLLFLKDGTGETTSTAAIDQPRADWQAAFKADCRAAEKQVPDGLFFWKFDPKQPDLQNAFTQFIESSNVVKRYQLSTWVEVKAAYRRGVIEAWQKRFPLSNTDAALEVDTQAQAQGESSVHRPPFIETQAFLALRPDAKGLQLRQLNPASFVAGRDSEAKARARSGSEWTEVSRANVVDALLTPPGVLGQLGSGKNHVALGTYVRLFLIAGGGIGKTTNMRWLEMELSKRTQIFAVGVKSSTVSGNTDDDVLAALVKHLSSAIERDLPWSARQDWLLGAIESGLRAERDAGNLVLLIDGLDHVESASIPFLKSIQEVRSIWRSSRIVVSGRPHAVQGWKDGTSHSADQVSLGEWRFLEPREFSEKEARQFLGQAQYEPIAEHLGTLQRVPRVLEYASTVPTERLVGIRTSADLYDEAMNALVDDTIVQGQTVVFSGPADGAVEQALQLLSALAFMSLCRPPTRDGKAPGRMDELPLDRDVKTLLIKRLSRTSPGYDAAALHTDLVALARFSAIVGNGILEGDARNSGGLARVVWANTTVEQFLAARWLAKYALGLDLLVEHLDGRNKPAVKWDEPEYDAARFRYYLFYPESYAPEAGFVGAVQAESEHGDLTYDLNKFLAEMPQASLTPTSWVAAASAWYLPDPLYQRDSRPPSSDRGSLRWSSEMLYRSWGNLQSIARTPVDNWWDIPYDTLATASPLNRRVPSDLPPRQSVTEVVAAIAERVLARFQGDLGDILNGAYGADLKQSARDMIAPEQWTTVPAGRFDMGTDEDHQGFPDKVKAYWLARVKEVRTGSKSPLVVAAECTPAKWFTGLQGKQLRDDDIGWLSAVFARVADNPDGSADAEALRDIEGKWRRKDETPAETRQDVASFVMQRQPILNRWFWLFAPRHKATVEGYLAGLEIPPVALKKDHPAIYVSWFDAWAFCQWARWTARDPADPGHPHRYAFRLPHEPEWEYAARWTVGPDGTAHQIERNQRYWWGDHFYKHEDIGSEETPPSDEAWADGAPGQTRAPMQAAPNGLGFRDMLGNVWEWMANYYDTHKEGDAPAKLEYSRFFPAGKTPVNGSRTMRGGLWYYLDLLATCTSRYRLTCDDRDYKMGFRVVREDFGQVAPAAHHIPRA